MEKEKEKKNKEKLAKVHVCADFCSLYASGILIPLQKSAERKKKQFYSQYH